MTVIIGYRFARKVLVGADSISVDDWNYKTPVTNNTKAFKVGRFIFGGCGPFRMVNLLRHQFEPPLFNPSRPNDVSEYMVKQFVPTLIQVFDAAGWTKEKEKQKEGGTFIVGAFGRLFEIQSDFSVSEYATPFASAGIGKFAAMGALHALYRLRRPKTEREVEDVVKRALEASEAACASVCGPMRLIWGGEA